MRRVNNVVAYCQTNLGDDMFVDFLSKKYPNEMFYLFCFPEHRKAFEAKKNIIMPKPSMCYIYRILHKLFHVPFESILYSHICKANIRIGGSIFIEPTNWRAKEYVNRTNKKTFYIGCNFGPYTKESYYKAARYSIENANSTCFRDNFSANLFKDLSNVRCEPDCLFSYPYKKVKTQEKLIGISVISFDKRVNLRQYADGYYKSIANFCDYAKENGYKIRFFSFCNSEGDLHAINSVLSQICDTSEMQVFGYDGDIDYFLEKYLECEALIATRFHAMIIGWANNRKVFPIIYSKKQQYVMDDVLFNGGAWDFDVNSVMMPEQILYQCYNNPILNVEQCIRNGKKQFEYLDAFLEK